MNNVLALQKIKWTIIYKTSTDFGVFAECLTKLLQSIDCKRSEIFMLPNEDKLFNNTFSSLCEKYNINYNFIDDNKQGVELAKGSYILYLTDHVYPSKNFLVKLTFCIDNYDKDEKAAVVAPISNDVYPKMGIQPNNLDDIQTQVSRAPKNEIPWAYTIDLSTYCLMFRKSIYSDNPTFSLFNPKDQVLNTLYNGFYPVLANDTLVYHFAEPIDYVYEVFKDIKAPEKLAVLYRIKTDTEYLRDIFVKSLQRSSEFSDNIYVLDDNSKIKMGLFLREKHPELWSKIKKYEKFSRPYDEKRDFNELLSWAEQDGCNWSLMLEGDEVVEDKVTKNYLSTLLNPVNMETMCYRLNHYHFWDNENQWRLDNPWGKINDVRLSRILPNRRITLSGTVMAQCGYTPHFPPQCIKNTSIRVKNYGHLHEADRQAKREFYEKLNIKINNQVSATFDHYTNMNGAHFLPWVENATVSIYTPTNKGGNLLYNWLDNISSFADEIIVGNDSNLLKDEDLEMLALYPTVKVVPIVMGDDFATGRNACLKECTKDFILQLDIDEQVEDLLPLRRMLDIDNQDAWLFTIPNIHPDGKSIITETMRLFRNKDGVKYFGRLHETIDQHVRTFGWRVSRSPVKIIHYGYTLQTPDEAFKKMQRYLDINMKQMKAEPMHGMVYYNTALHFIEDDLIEDAIKLLQICIPLLPSFRLGGLELAKCYMRLADKWMDLSLKGLKDTDGLKQGFNEISTSLKKIKPVHYAVAKGHCLNWFGSRPQEAKFLREHIIKMEKTIEELKTKSLESAAK